MIIRPPIAASPPPAAKLIGSAISVPAAERELQDQRSDDAHADQRNGMVGALPGKEAGRIRPCLADTKPISFPLSPNDTPGNGDLDSGEYAAVGCERSVGDRSTR